MKASHSLIILLFVLSALSCEAQNTSLKNDILKEVNVLMGSGANGAVIPVSVVPHGMVQLGPDTRNSGSGYHYDDRTIIGFSHTHTHTQEWRRMR